MNKRIINKNLKDLTLEDINYICYDSCYCAECPLYLYDTHLCLEKYKPLREILDINISGVFDKDKNL